MSYDQATKWLFIALAASTAWALSQFLPIEIDLGELLVPTIGLVILGTAGIYYRNRDADSIVLCIVTLIQMTCFSAAVSLLIYEMTMLRMPLRDSWLIEFDSAIGYSAKAVADWIRSRPLIDHFSTWCYQFIIPLSAVTVISLAFLSQRRLLEQFALQFMLGTFVCGIFAGYFPAHGPLYGFGIKPYDWQQNYLNHVWALRSGDTFEFSWPNADGLVTFPSFHTAWAIMLLLVWRQQSRWLSVPVGMVCVLIVIATLTTGEHYACDVIGGCVLAAICYWVSSRVTIFCEDAHGKPRKLTVPRFGVWQWRKFA